MADATKAPLIADVLRLRGTKAIVVRGHDGLDEASIFADSTCWATWETGSFEVSPRDLGIGAYPADAIRGGDSTFNADIARRLLDGEVSGALAAVADAVTLNAALAHVAWLAATTDSAVDPRSALPTSFAMLREQLVSGAAGDVLNTWIAASQR